MSLWWILHPCCPLSACRPWPGGCLWPADSAASPVQVRVHKGTVDFSKHCLLDRAAASAGLLWLMLDRLQNLIFFAEQLFSLWFLRETWLCAGEFMQFSDFLPPHCDFPSSHRGTSRGGGPVSVSSFHRRPIPLDSCSSFELQLFNKLSRYCAVCQGFGVLPSFIRILFRSLQTVGLLIVGDYNIYVLWRQEKVEKRQTPSLLWNFTQHYLNIRKQ